MTEASRRRLELETRLQMALDQEKELYVLYQPQVDPEGRLVGCEALVRWRSESLGEVNPGELIPHAEATGLIQPLGIWMLRQTCRQIAAWRRAGLHVPKIAVNVSSQQFLDAEAKLPRIVRECLEQNDLSPADLELEITESCLLPGGHAEPQILELAAMGISIAVDDFGTGYSSLSMLHNLPITKLKIDRCFVQNVDTNPALQEIIQATVTMAGGMGMSTLAEGVERAEEVEFLAAHGCGIYQGYHFSRPVSADQFADLLARGSIVPADKAAPV
jgi:EAL domain-containing protein (putative c-di-GMP-specific phosphodiesterase class I)